MTDEPRPYDGIDLREKRGYVESRSAREHWGAAELELVDREARWLATVDRLIHQVDALKMNAKTDMRDAENLRNALKASEQEVHRLRRIPADEVLRELYPVEKMSLSIAKAKSGRGESVGANTTFMLVLAIERLLGTKDWTKNV